MTRYHISPEDFEPRVCTAEKQCKYAEDGAPHFGTLTQARAAADVLLSGFYGTVPGALAKNTSGGESELNTVPEENPEDRVYGYTRTVLSENKRLFPDYVTKGGSQNLTKAEAREALARMKSRNKRGQGHLKDNETAIYTLDRNVTILLEEEKLTDD